MGKSMSSTSLEARLLLPQCAVWAYAEIAVILDCTVYNRVHPLIYWLLIFNCSIITYFTPVSLEKSPCFRAFFHRIYVRA